MQALGEHLEQLSNWNDSVSHYACCEIERLFGHLAVANCREAESCLAEDSGIATTAPDSPFSRLIRIPNL